MSVTVDFMKQGPATNPMPPGLSSHNRVPMKALQMLGKRERNSAAVTVTARDALHLGS